MRQETKETLKTIYVIVVQAMFVLAICYLFFGCVSAKAVLPDGTQVNYTRIGDQQLKGLQMIKTERGSELKLESQKSEADALSETMKTAREMVDRMILIMNRIANERAGKQ